MQVKPMVFVGVLAAASAAGLAVALLLPSAASPQPAHLAPSARARVTQTSARRQAPAASARARLGIISYNLPLFEQQTGIHPSLSAVYIDWGTPFPADKVLSFHRLGVTTLIVLEPRDVGPRSIAAGKEDAYLAGFAAAERKLGMPILLSFAPEANGIWYSWGKGHISPVLYKEMYRHVHYILLKDGAKHITWLWQVDRSSATTERLSSLWPGRSYVNDIGFDGQLQSPSATYASVFGPTFAQVRAFTRTPVMLSEVGVAKGPSRARQITALFSAARKANLSALNFFDVGTWNFDQDRAALRAIRTAIRTAAKP
jgi:mannan endo-1,4-beta-mannosidase